MRSAYIDEAAEGVVEEEVHARLTQGMGVQPGKATD